MDNINHLHFDYLENRARQILIKILRNVNINHLFNNKSLLHLEQTPEEMKYLLDRGGNPNLENSLKQTPIFFQTSLETIKLLVERGANMHHVDIMNCNCLFWKKNPNAMNYLLYNNVRINYNLTFKSNNLRRFGIYINMLIDGGYDPYYEKNITTLPVFLQRNEETLMNMLLYLKNKGIDYPVIDKNLETILFKSNITPRIIRKIRKIKVNNLIDINQKNHLGNTALHCHFDENIIIELLNSGIDTEIKNLFGDTAKKLHLRKNNFDTCYTINYYIMSRKIQRFWRKYWFDRTYIPPKFYKIKQEFIKEFVLLPPSECKTFQGGIEFQKANDDFNLCLR
jgi:hypothetical protein